MCVLSSNSSIQHSVAWLPVELAISQHDYEVILSNHLINSLDALIVLIYSFWTRMSTNEMSESLTELMSLRQQEVSRTVIHSSIVAKPIRKSMYTLSMHHC